MSLHVSPGSVRFTRPFQHIGPSRSHSGRRSTGSDPGRIGASPSHCVTGRLRRVVERDLGVGKRVFGRRKTSQNTEEHVKIPDNTKEGMTQNTVRTHEKVYIYIYIHIHTGVDDPKSLFNRFWLEHHEPSAQMDSNFNSLPIDTGRWQNVAEHLLQ